MPVLRGVIFDMDGVLVLTEDAHWRSWRAVAAERGLDLSHERFLSCFGRTNPDCIRIMFGDDVPPGEAARIADEKECAFRAIVGEAVPLAPGVHEVLAALRMRRAVLAVGSSAPRENIDLVLDGGGIREHFVAAIDGTQVAHGKPAPDVFLRAAEALRLPPEACAVVEDAPAGIAAARAAGMCAIGVATTNAPAALLDAGAHEVHATVADLVAWVDAAFGSPDGR